MKQKWGRIHPGIVINSKWSLKHLKVHIKLIVDFNLEDICSYDSILAKVYMKARGKQENLKWTTLGKTEKIPEINDLDPALWEMMSIQLTDAVELVNTTCIDYGVSELESHLLSMKFATSVLSKFRVKFFYAMNAETDRTKYDCSSLSSAINVIHSRYERLMATDDYKFSVKAAETHDFRMAAVWTTVGLLEETGAILFEKLSI